MASLKLEISLAESLLLWRRRVGRNQVEAAAYFGATVDHYRSWEAGEHPSKPPRLALGALRPYETCYLLRRRRGVTQESLAKAIGCTRLWVIRMEDGSAPCNRLVAYWKSVK